MTVADYIVSQRSANRKTATNLAWRYRMDAHEVYQDSVEKALRYGHNFVDNSSGSFCAWFYRVARTVCLDQYQKNKRLPRFSAMQDLAVDDGMTPERREQLAAVWWRLRRRYGRSVLPLYMYSQGFKYDEISAQLGVPITTVKSWMIKCRRFLLTTPVERIRVEEKQCRTCATVQPIGEFYKHATTADGFFGECKKCVKNRTYERQTILARAGSYAY